MINNVKITIINMLGGLMHRSTVTHWLKIHKNEKITRRQLTQSKNAQWKHKRTHTNTNTNTHTQTTAQQNSEFQMVMADGIKESV